MQLCNPFVGLKCQCAFQHVSMLYYKYQSHELLSKQFILAILQYRVISFSPHFFLHAIYIRDRRTPCTEEFIIFALTPTYYNGAYIIIYKRPQMLIASISFHSS